MLQLSTDEATEFIRSNQDCVVVFGASWCKNCKLLCASIDEASLALPIAKVDVEESAEFADAHGVSSLPKSVFFCRGQALREFVGSNYSGFLDFTIGTTEKSASYVEPEIPIINNGPLVHKVPRKVPQLPHRILDLLQIMNLPDLRFSLRELTSENSVVCEAFESITELTDVAGITSLYVYKVPTTSPDGTCSNIEHLAKRPFNLAVDAYHIAANDDDMLRLGNHPCTDRLAKLNRVVAEMNLLVDADWVGIYRVVQAGDGLSLLKEAYLGEPSRALFPITETFAMKSTNSWVALTAQARIIENTRVRADGVSYYECSKSVQSELCVPIVRRHGEELEVLGIIDLESWKPEHFTSGRVLTVVKVAADLAENFMGVNGVF